MSGRINLSNLSDSLKEHLNGLGLTEEQVNELIENALIEINEKNVEQDEVVNGLVDKVGELNGLMTEEKGDLVGAINELFQSANNGKELIANAIGEPLNAEDTFNAMSNDINGLLSTFKTNMMNNGIIIESGDKFEQLIDKIATMVEEGSGKGIKFASQNSLSLSFGGDFHNANVNTTIDTNLDFVPNLIICIFSSVKDGYINQSYGYDNSANHTNLGFTNNDTYYNSLSGTAKMTINNITAESFVIATTGGMDTGNRTFVSGVLKEWYAIGIGEEDTTLRDSLASILQEEGVSVTEEDDMASLISKVDSEFTKDNNTINSLTNELAGKVTPAGTAVASNVLTGKTFINNTGQTITGTMANNGTKTITPNTSAQSLGAGYYDKITINGDADLVAANIVSGKNIFGVTGTATIVSMGGRKVVTGTSSFSLKDGKGSDITVSGLPFKPSIIVIMGTANNNAYVGGFYVSDITPDYAFSAHRAIGGSSASATFSTVGANTSDTYYVVNGGFRLRVTASSINGHTGNVTWYAFE